MHGASAKPATGLSISHPLAWECLAWVMHDPCVILPLGALCAGPHLQVQLSELQLAATDGQRVEVQNLSHSVEEALSDLWTGEVASV